MAWFDDNAPQQFGNRYNPDSPVYQLADPNAAPTAASPYQASTPVQQAAPAPSGGGDTSNPLFQGIRPDLVQYFVSHGITPTGRGSGPTDIAYLNDQMNQPGQDPGYWLNEKLPNQVFGGGGGTTGTGSGGGGATMPSSMPIGSGANQYGNFGVAPAPYTPQPFTGNVFQPQAFQGTPYQPPGFTGTTFQPGQFTAPTGLDYTNDPGYQARMKMGTDAIQNSAAARGSILSGGILKALERYGQDYGSNEFGNVFGRALQTYGTNVNAGQLGYSNLMNTAGFNQQAGQLGFGNQMAVLGQQNQAGQQGFANSYQNYLNNQAQNFQASQANIANQRNAQQDYWSQLAGMYQTGQNAIGASYQPVAPA